MTTISQTIPSLGTPPLTTDPVNFDTRADTLYGTSLPAVITATNTWSGQANTVAGEVNTNATNAQASANTATGASAAAIAAVNATQWVSGQAYLTGAVVWSPINFYSYRANTNTSGTTDPSLSASWVSLNIIALGSQVTGTLPVANGGTALSTLGTAGQVLTVNSGATALEYALPAGGFTLGTPITTTSGTAADFTGLPAGVKQVIVTFNGVSFSSGGNFNALLGTSGGFVSSGYVNAGVYLYDDTFTSSCYSTTQITLVPSATGVAAATRYYGQLELSIINSSSNIWGWSFTIGVETSASAYTSTGGGSITLASALTQLRIRGDTGSRTFDAGSINIMYI